jgi:fatty acid desaturase
METIDDIRARFGNPHAGTPDGPVQSIHRAFRHPESSLRLASLIVAILGMFIVLIGVWTLVIAIAAAGAGVLAAAVLMFIRAEYIGHHRGDFAGDPEER